MSPDKDDRAIARKYGTRWSRAEVVLTLALYKTPGVGPDKNDPKVQELARLLDRTSGSVVLKLVNLRALESGFDHRLREEADRLKKQFHTDPTLEAKHK